MAWPFRGDWQIKRLQDDKGNVIVEKKDPGRGPCMEKRKIARGSKDMSEGKRALETVNRETYTEVVQGNTVRKVETFPRQSDPEIRERIIRNRERSKRMNMAYVVFLTAASVLCVFFCVMFLQLQTISTSLQKELMRNQTELKELKMENDTVYNEIVASVDLEKVRETAMNRFGMAYPKEDQIVSFKSVSKDYVRQYAEIPESTFG